MTDRDELFKGIDEAANNLFDQYIVKKPESVPVPPSAESELDLELELNLEQETESTSPPPKPPSAPAPPAPVAPAPAPPAPAPRAPESSVPEVRKSSEPPANEELFAKLEEALLTIDWEVNSENILKGKSLLSKLGSAEGWSKTSLPGRVADQMDKVLSSMLESPEQSSVSAPSQLKNALKTLKESGTPGAEADQKLKTTLDNLHELLASDETSSRRINDDLQAATPVESIPSLIEEPTFDFSLELDMEPSADHASSQGATVPLKTTEALRKYTVSLAGLIKLLTPMEDLFASRPAMAKLHAATKRLKEKLASQEKLFRKTFSPDFSTYNGLGTLNSWLESQLEVIKRCVNRIGKMERLFGKTAGYEKLHARSQKIRKSLEKQLDALTLIVGGTPSQHQFDLTGEYPAVIQPAPLPEQAAPAAAVSAVASPEAMVDKCISLAWSLEQGSNKKPRDIGLQIRKTLGKLKASLSGSALRSPGASAAANAAASIAGHATKCRWDWLLKTSWGGQLVGIAPEQVAYESKSTFPLSSFKDLTFFSLKKLKSTPWKKLRGLFSGELAELDNSILNDMELEIAKPPASFPGSTKKKVYLVILYSGGKGKVFLVDAPTEAISVAEEALWSPGTASESDNIAGTLTVYGSTIPVVSID
jgi:hypothetical protein